jgi:hypothetical protein
MYHTHTHMHTHTHTCIHIHSHLAQDFFLCSAVAVAACHAPDEKIEGRTECGCLNGSELASVDVYMYVCWNVVA